MITTASCYHRCSHNSELLSSLFIQQRVVIITVHTTASCYHRCSYNSELLSLLLIQQRVVIIAAHTTASSEWKNNNNPTYSCPRGASLGTMDAQLRGRGVLESPRSITVLLYRGV